MTDRQGDPERHREQQQPQGRQPQQPSQQGHQQQPGQQPPQQQSQQPSRYQPGQQQPQQQSGQQPQQQRGQQPRQQRGQQPQQPQQGQQPQQPPQQQGQPAQQHGQPSGQPQGHTSQQPPQRQMLSTSQQPPQQQAGQQSGQRSSTMGQQPQQGQQMGGPPMQQPSIATGMGGGMGQQLGQPQLKPITIEDIIETDVETVDPDTPIATAAAKMESAGVGSVVITDENDHPTGILTDRKIALALEEMPDIGEHESQELARGEMITADTDTDVFESISQLSEHSIRRLPIVDENGELAGIVTLDDILILLVTELESAVEVIEAQSPRY